MTLHAGPYIFAQYQMAVERAAECRSNAERFEQDAKRFREMAVEADAEAERWAEGTDIKSRLASQEGG